MKIKRKLLIALVLLISIFFTSCNREEENAIYKLEYVVFYPGYNDYQTVTATHPLYWNSDRGTNYIKHYDITGPYIYTGSAPYKIISYTKKDIK